jgi:hypothetical protein
MFNITITLSTPFYDGDDDIVYPLQVASKRELAKVEHQLLKAQAQLRKLSDDALDKKSGVFEGADPQEVHFEYLVTKGGVKWTRAVHEWPGQTDMARSYLVGMLDQLMTEIGHGNKKAKRGKAKRG